jgi:hypothetical protein
MKNNKCDFFANDLHHINEYCNCSLTECKVLEERHKTKEMEKQINVDEILKKHGYMSYDDEGEEVYYFDFEDGIKPFIKEIIDSVLELAAENAETNYDCADDPVRCAFVDKSSILNTKEQIKY